MSYRNVLYIKWTVKTFSFWLISCKIFKNWTWGALGKEWFNNIIIYECQIHRITLYVLLMPLTSHQPSLEYDKVNKRIMNIDYYILFVMIFSLFISTLQNWENKFFISPKNPWPFRNLFSQFWVIEKKS